VAQVVLENIYKSFASRRGEGTSVPAPAEPLLATGIAPVNEAASTPAEPATPLTPSVSVLRRINLTVNDGEFMVLVGPSGCGKSTLLRLIAGLEELTGGNIWVGDRLVNELPPKARDIAMVFQSYALYPHMTVYDNLAFGLRRTKLGNPELANPESTRTRSNRRQSGLPVWVENWLVSSTRSLPKGLRYWSDRERAVDERVRTVAQMFQIEHSCTAYPNSSLGGKSSEWHWAEQWPAILKFS